MKKVCFIFTCLTVEPVCSGGDGWLYARGVYAIAEYSCSSLTGLLPYKGNNLEIVELFDHYTTG